MLALFGLPSIGSIVEGIVNFFFQDLARALVPDFLKNASVSTIKWLVAVPDPSSWTHVGQLEGDMRYLAVSLLSVSFTAAIVRYLVAGLSGSGHPLQALASTFMSAGMLVGYPWAASQMVAMVNTLTNTVLSIQIVGEGLQQTVGIMFGGALLVGSGGVFLALLVIVGVVLGAIMFALKVLLLLAFALLYVTGPLVIAVRPLPELAHLSRAWGTALLGISLVPIGWTILFAVAGSLSLDATSFGAVGKTGAVGGLPTHVAGVFAALLTFFLAVKLPFGVLSRLRGVLGGVGGGGHSESSSGGSGFQRVADANARLRSATLQTGRVVGLAAGALGAPAGGPAGAAMRAVGRLSGPLGLAASFAGGVIGNKVGGAGSRLVRSKAGKALSGSSRAQGLRERFARAGRVLSDAPRQARDAAHATDTSGRSRRSRPGARARTGARDNDRPSPGTRVENGPEERVANPRKGSTPLKTPQPKPRERDPSESADRQRTPQPKGEARKGGPERGPDGTRTEKRSDATAPYDRGAGKRAPLGGNESGHAGAAPRTSPQRPTKPANGQEKAPSGSAPKRKAAASEKPKRVGQTPSGVSSTGAQQHKQSSANQGSARTPRAPRTRASGSKSGSGASKTPRQSPPREAPGPGRLGWFRFKRANGRG